jgi:hypothetical protein
MEKMPGASAMADRRRFMRSFLMAVITLLLTAAAYGADSQGIGQQSASARQRSLKLFDANNKVVGRVSSFQGADGVFLTINGSIIFVPVTQLYDATTQTYSSTQFSWLSFNKIPFVSSNCTGQPLIPFDSNGPRPSVTIRQGSDVIVYIGSSTNSSVVSTASNLQETYCTTTPGTVSAVQPESSFSITQKYPEPLTIHY